VAEVKRIVCLANSRKHFPGRCVAGKEWNGSDAGRWIRPVSGRPTQEVSQSEQRYENGTLPEVLDIVDVPLLEATPGSFQTENWLLDSNRRWARVGHLAFRDLGQFTDTPGTLWLNGYETQAGSNDRVPEQEAENLRGSLFLLKLDTIAIRVFAPGADFGNPRKRVQAGFTYRRVEYRLWVTDLVIEGEYRPKKEGDYEIGECYVTVSLGEADKGFCYKLVAAVILPK
jgi:hypothetical protein